jgi:2-C-methyl-D-erythritol 4-phosphate cytidylyltransferase
LAKSLGVVIAAAGQGTRMKIPVNKQYVVLEGKPVILYSLELLAGIEGVIQMVVAAHPDEVEYCQRLMPADRRIKVVPGGRRRQDSVYNALKCLPKDTELVAVHDGARPLLCGDMVRALVEAAARWGAAVPGVPVKDTLKMVDEFGLVTATLERSRICSIQTPQVFDYQTLLDAYRQAYAEGVYGTDDASLYERYCGPVKVVPGDYRNLKITTAEDLVIAAALLKSQDG